MRSLIVLEEKKEIFVNIKMEEVILAAESKKNSNIVNMNVSQDNEAVTWWNGNLNSQEIFSGIEIFAAKYHDYKWYFDFDNVGSLHNNAVTDLVAHTKQINDKYILNTRDLDSGLKTRLRNNCFVEGSIADGYENAFSEILLTYIKTNCTIGTKKNETGEVIKNYINLKEVFEQKEYLMKISFLLSKKIAYTLGDGLKEYSLFCHTLNGACLAENLSLLLGINLLFADRLNTTRKMRKMFMPDHIDQNNRCIIVTDMVCQGHEVLRAKDIVLMLGGIPSMYVGVIDLKIHDDIYYDMKNELADDYFLMRLNKEQTNILNYGVSLEGPV